MPFSIRLLVLLVAAASLFTAAARVQAQTVTGSVTYLDRMALRPGAVVEVELLDVSRADAAAARLSSQRFAIDRVPFAFTLSYDPVLIDDRASYEVSATILLDETVLYRTTTAYPVLTRNAPDHAEIIVERARPSEGQALTGTRWEAFELRGSAIETAKRPAIAFHADGQVAMNSGCNRFNGPVDIDGSKIGFSDKIAGTLMACPPPYDQLERAFLSVLPETTQFKRTGRQLALVNSAGITVLRLAQIN